MGDFVQLNVSNSMNDYISFEKKFAKDIKVADLKWVLADVLGNNRTVLFFANTWINRNEQFSLCSN